MYSKHLFCKTVNFVKCMGSLFVLLGFKLHPHCKDHMTAFQAFTGRERLQVPCGALNQASAGMRVKPLTISRLA